MESGTTKYDFSSLIKRFKITGSIQSVTPHGSGHIHDTFHLRNTDPKMPDYLMQRINHHVFKRVPELMTNIEQVTGHIRQKLISVPAADPNREVLTLIPTQEDKYYIEDNSGNFWRLYLFIDHARSYDKVETTEQAYEGGKAFGKFQAYLSDLPGDSLYETIPDFHNIEKRLQTFSEKLQLDPVGRVKEVVDETQFIMKRADEMAALIRLGHSKKIPVRVTHNDTKFNNVLLNSQNKALCVIDLDTVMPGFVPYDFGDSIRTTINTAAEDEKELQKIDINIPLFEAYAKGYLEETLDFLTSTEIQYLVFGCKLMPYIMGVRFLTDYMDGDHYYKIHFPSHNLQRAKAQFQLLSKIEAREKQLQDIVNKLSNGKI